MRAYVLRNLPRARKEEGATGSGGSARTRTIGRAPLDGGILRIIHEPSIKRRIQQRGGRPLPLPAYLGSIIAAKQSATTSTGASLPAGYIAWR